LTRIFPESSTDASGTVPVIGLTGAPAAGKSTVASVLRDAGCAVIDVDALGHRALEQPELAGALTDEFGPHVVRDDGSVDRAALGRVAFASPAALTRLEELVHPRVRVLLDAELDAARASGTRAVVVDAALLFESGIDALCGTTVTVHAPEDRRTAWAGTTRGWSADELRSREARQWSADEKRARADRVLVNDGDLAALRERTLALLDELAPTTQAGR